jgi:hypothetical protein
MLAWIVRLILIMAAPIAALVVSRDSLHFDVAQTFVAILLVVGLMLLVALRANRRRPGERS